MHPSLWHARFAGRALAALLSASMAFLAGAQDPSASAAASAAASAPASGTAQARVGSLGPDLFAAGGSVTISQPVSGDLFAAAGTLDVLAAVGGDALLSGGTLRVGAPVAHDIYAAGGRVSLNAPVQGNARMFGGSIEIGTQGRVAGNVIAAGGEVHVLGPIVGYLRAGAGRVLINAEVGGDVEVGTGQLELGPRAHVRGKLRHVGPSEVKRDPAARVDGAFERVEPPSPPASASRHPARERVRHAGAGWVWIGGLMVLAAVLAAALPGWYPRVAQALRGRLAMSLLVGFIVLVCVPVATLILLVTVIGVPLALLAIALYLALLLVGYVSSAVAAGHLALARLKPENADRAAWRALAAALAMLLIALAAQVPYVGGFVAFAFMLAGIGAFLLPLRGVRSAGA